MQLDIKVEGERKFNHSIPKSSNVKTGVTRKQSTPNFPKNEHFLPSVTHTYVCLSIGKKFFWENLVCFVFLKHSFWDSCFCLITDGICKQKSQFWPTFVAYSVKQLGSWQLYIKSLLYIYTVLERSFVIIFTVCGLLSWAVYCIFYISVQRFC